MREQRSNGVSECDKERGEEGNSDPTGLVSVIRRGGREGSSDPTGLVSVIRREGRGADGDGCAEERTLKLERG